MKHPTRSLRLSRKANYSIFLLIIAGACALRVVLAVSGRLSFDSDQAIFGIGALRVLREHSHYVFVPGHDYGADFISEYFAPLHMVFRPSTRLMQLGMLPIFALLCASVRLATKAMFRDDSLALVATALVAFAPSMITDWTFRASSLYLQALIPYFFLLATLFPLVRMLHRSDRRAKSAGSRLGQREHNGRAYTSPSPGIYLRLWLVGLFAGLGYWGHPIMILLLAGTAAGLLLSAFLPLWRSIRRDGLPGLRSVALGGACAMAGFLLAAGPALLAPLLSRLPPVRANSMATVDLVTVAHQCTDFITTSVPILLGFYHNYRIPNHDAPLILRCLALGLFACGAIASVARGISRSSSRAATLVITGACAANVAGCVLTHAGALATEPRYLLSLYFAFATGASGLIMMLWRRHSWPGQIAAAGALATLIIANLSSCLLLPRSPLTGKAYISPEDNRLLKKLASRGIDRVTCRLSPGGYWNAYRLSYLSDERILFAPAPSDLGIYIGSDRYQREVDGAPRLAYMVVDSEREILKKVLQEQHIAYDEFSCGRYLVCYNLKPDLLRSVPSEKYFAENYGRK